MRVERPIAMPSGKQSLSSRTLNGAVWSLLSQAVTALVALIVFIMMSRLVSHSELGEYMLAIVGIGAVQWLAFNAYREPLIQASRIASETRDSVFWFSAGVATLLAVVLLGIAHYLRLHGHTMITASCLSLLAAKLFFDTLISVPMALCYRALRFKVLAKVNIAVSLLGLPVSVALLYAGWGVLAVAAVQGVMSLLSFVFVLIYCAWLPRLHFSWRDLGLLRSYSPHVVLWQGVEAFNMYLDRFLVGTRLSPQALGIYGFGRRLNDIVIEVLVGAAGNVALPTYAALQNNVAELKRTFIRSLRIVTFGVFPVIGILYGVADELVVAVFGAKWASAVPIYKCFLLLGAIQTIGVFQASLIRSIGHANLWARYQVLQAVANAVVLYFAIDAGIYVLAFAVVVRTYIVWMYAVIMTCRLIDIRVLDYLRIFVKPALGAVLACIVAAGVFHLAQGVPPIAMIAAATVMAGLTYVAAARLVMRSVADDVLALITRSA
jgi:teichuronic acid exporter